MIIKIKTLKEEFEINTENKKSVIKASEDKYYAGRLSYYLLKAVYNIPRLYGYLKREPIESWRENFERHFVQLIKSDVDISSTKFYAEYEIIQEAIKIEGKINGLDISAKVTLLEKPENIPQGIQGNFLVDSFYFSRIEKIKPYIIPSSRAGLLYAFAKFLVYQQEGMAPGIPKAFGIASEFINSMLLPQGFTDEIEGHKVWINNEDNYVYVDDNILYNVTSNILSLLALKIYLTRGNEKEIIILEEPEAHINAEEKKMVKEWLNQCKSKLVIISNEEEW